jgi:hypothetical protein
MALITKAYCREKDRKKINRLALIHRFQQYWIELFVSAMESGMEM